jgi:hypothetical protein
MNPEKDNPKKGKVKKVLIWTTGGVVLAGLSWLGWKWYKSKTEDNEKVVPDFSTQAPSTEIPLPTTPHLPSPPSAYTPPSSGSQNAGNNGFPIKRGSSGLNVKLLQQAINKLLKNRKIVEDGSFGRETESALVELKQTPPFEFDEQRFRVFTASLRPGGAIPVNAKAVGLLLYKYWSNADFIRSLAALKLLNSTTQYSEANDYFKNNQLPGGRVSIVTGLISKFTQENQRQLIRAEFLRIGLKLNADGKWSLSGFDLPLFLKTIRTTQLTYPTGQAVNIPANVVVGSKIGKTGEYTVIKTAEGLTVSILTKDLIRYETP